MKIGVSVGALKGAELNADGGSSRNGAVVARKENQDKTRSIPGASVYRGQLAASSESKGRTA